MDTFQHFLRTEKGAGPRVGLGGAPTRASYYTYTHEPTTSPVTVDVLVEAAGAVLGPPGSINLPAPKKRSMS